MTPDLIVGAGQVADATGKVIDLASRIFRTPSHKNQAPSTPPAPPTPESEYAYCELKNVNIQCEDGRIDWTYRCRRLNSDGSLSSEETVTIPTTPATTAEIVKFGIQALEITRTASGSREDGKAAESRV